MPFFAALFIVQSQHVYVVEQQQHDSTLFFVVRGFKRTLSKISSYQGYLYIFYTKAALSSAVISVSWNLWA
jgi:hypothetical protein